MSTATTDPTQHAAQLEKTRTAGNQASGDISDMNQTAVPADHSPRKMKPVLWALVVTSILASMFLFALDNTIVADVQPAIIESLGSVEKLPWISVGYALGAISINLFLSALFAKFDVKWLFVTGVLMFEIGSAICGSAPTMNALIVGRIICGLGGVGIYVGGMNLLSVMTTEEERPMYLSIVGLSWGFGTVFGPIIGGALADSSASWRWCFYLNLFVGVVVGPIYIFLIPSMNPRPGISVLSRLYELDWLGAILNAGALVTLVMGLAFGGGVYAWNSYQIKVLFIISGVLWITFVLQQAFSFLTTKANRLFPVQYLKDLEMCILFAQVAAGVTVVYVPLFFVPLFFQFTQGDSSLQSGVRLLPLVFFQVFGTVLSGATLNKVGYYFIFYFFGGILNLVGGALLFLVKIDTPASAIYGYSVLVGIGCGLYTQAGYPIAQLKVTPAEVPTVVQFIGYGQISGITVALTVANSIFLNEATTKIANILPDLPRQEVQRAITGTGGPFLHTLNPALRALVLNAIVKSISNVYGMIIAAGALSVTLALFLKRERIGQRTRQENLS